MRLKREAGTFLIWFISRTYLVFFLAPFISDLEYYRYFSGRVLSGEIPYFQFAFEYPPLALVLIALPEWLSRVAEQMGLGASSLEHYRLAFHLLALIPDWFLWRAVRESLRDSTSLGHSGQPHSYALGEGAYLVVSALMGPLYFDRLDIWMIWLLVEALRALSLRRQAGWLSLGILLKLVPAIALPVFWGRLRPFERGSFLIIALLPFAVVCGALYAGTGQVSFLAYHLHRGLQIESTWSILSWLGEQVRPLGDLKVTQGFGGWNVAGSWAARWLAVSTPAMAVALLAVTYVCIKRGARADSAQLRYLGALALVLCFMIFGKVFSPQYMIWLTPLVWLVTANVTNLFWQWGLRVGTAAAIGLTMWVFYRYGELLQLDSACLIALWLRALLISGLLLFSFGISVSPNLGPSGRRAGA